MRYESARPTSHAVGSRPSWLAASSAMLLSTLWLSACASSTTSWRGSGVRHAQSSSFETAQAGNDVAMSQPDAAWYEQRASENDLPSVWLSEVRQASAEIQARRAQAQAERVRRDSLVSERTAQADASLESALSSEQTSLADAKRRQIEAAARIDAMEQSAAAQESSYESDARYKDALASARSSENMASLKQMEADAESVFQQAQAEHERMLADRIAVEKRGDADIEHMTKVADMTESSARSKVAQLRRAAESTATQTDASVQDLAQRIDTMGTRTLAQVRRLRTQASTMREESEATTTELIARADALESADVDHAHQLALDTSELAFQDAQAQTKELRQQIEAILSEAEGELERRHGEAKMQILIAESSYKAQKSAIKKFRSDKEAEIFVNRAKADRIESDARANYVAARAQAQARSVRETTAHQIALSDAQFEQFKAQAESDAANLIAEFMQAYAQRLAQGDVDLPLKQSMADLAEAQTPGVDNPTPAMQIAPVEPTIVEPMYVGQFKTSLAMVAGLRTKADAIERSVKATADERMAQIDAWWRLQQGKNAQMLAEADAFEQRTTTRAQELRVTAQAKLDVAEAERSRAQAEANAKRKESLAEIINLRAEADATLARARAKTTELLARAEAAEAGGAAMLQSLKAARDASQRRGDAKSRELVVLADTLETEQKALVAQMRQQITSSAATLGAELARLDQSAESFLQIAEATHEEQLAAALAFDAKSKIDIETMRAGVEIDRRIAQADVQRLLAGADAQRLTANAQTQRLKAAATAKRGRFEARDMTQRAAIVADARISDAKIDAIAASTDAQDAAVRARFNSRVATVLAQRDRAAAGQLLNERQTMARVERAQASADAFHELSDNAMSNLKETVRRFELAARQNWDVRLASPALLASPLPMPAEPDWSFEYDVAERDAVASAEEDN